MSDVYRVQVTVVIDVTIPDGDTVRVTSREDHEFPKTGINQGKLGEAMSFASATARSRVPAELYA